MNIQQKSNSIKPMFIQYLHIPNFLLGGDRYENSCTMLHTSGSKSVLFKLLFCGHFMHAKN